LLSELAAWGYERIITPLFEVADVLERGLGDDASAAAIRFVEPMTGEVVALRPDITPQIARIAATRLADIDGPLRLCYEGAVTRLTTGARGQREILQAGAELIGAPSPDGDVEILSVAAAALGVAGIDRARLDVGHVALPRFALSRVADPSLRNEIEERLARKDRHGVAAAARSLDPDLRAVLEALPSLYGEPAPVLARARALPLDDVALAALDRVEVVLAQSRDQVEDDLHSTITIDLGEVRGFDYYTGLRISGFVDGVGDAALRGGRYDELVGRYGRPMNAVGFAIDIEAIAHAQSSLGIDLRDRARGVLIDAMPSRRSDATRIASALRETGFRAAVDIGGNRSGDVVDYARAVGFASVLRMAEGKTEIAGADASDAVARALGGDVGALVRTLEGDSP
jgi:ATP phosphoribosyltransferase regulatory subunit